MSDPTASTSGVEFHVLGPMEALIDGHPIDVGGARQRRLLSLLISKRRSTIDIHTIAEHVWDDTDRPNVPGDAIRTYISRLRRSLGTNGIDPTQLLVTQPPGYRLEVDDDHIDSRRFEQLVLAARTENEQGDAARALAQLENALAEWRGTPYQEFSDRTWVTPEVTKLEELRRVALEERAAALVDLGAHAEVVGDLEQLIADDPLRARPVELSMIALFRSNRQAEALRVAARYRRALADVGLEPPERIADLERRVAGADPSLRPTTAPETVRGYHLGEAIAVGPVSDVYRSVQPILGREVAVERIRAEFADRPEFVRRFEAAAQRLAALEHPHIVPIYDYWREPGAAYLVMRWLRGGSLQQRIARRRLDVEESIELAIDIGSALSSVHHAGSEHGDVRSANILLDDEGNRYLTNFAFGVATGTSTLDRTDDARGLARVLFEALTGLEATSADATGRPAGPPSLAAIRPELPATVEAVLLRATLGSEEERYRTVDDFVDAFVSAIDPVARHARALRQSPERPVSNPYKGLRAFQESDADDFFGRDRLAAEVVGQVAAHRMVAVVGPSGSGKSSIVRAGVLPRLRTGAAEGSDQWFITTMRPGRRPFDELESALNRVATSPTVGLAEAMREHRRGIGRAIGAVLPDESAQLVLVIDQFEELFTLVADPERRSFIDGLVAASTGEPLRLRTIVTVRADQWDRPLRHPELGRLLAATTVTVTPMLADEIEQSITRPAHRAGVSIDHGLVAELVADVHDQPGALPLLQYLLTEVFDARRAGVMELSTARRLGGLAGSLARRAEEIHEDLPPADRDSVRRLFSRLVAVGETTDDTARPAPRSELTSVPDEVIERFAAARLLTFDRDPVSYEPTIALAHEALIHEWPRLRTWIDDDRDGLRVMRHLARSAADWEADGHPDSELYRGARLEAARRWAEDHGADLAEVERSFLDASTTQDVRQQHDERLRVRRLRRLLATTSIVAVLALVAGTIAVLQRGRAQDNATAARSAQAESEEALAAADSAADAERAARDRADESAAAERVARQRADESAGAAEEASQQAFLQQRIAESAALRDAQPSLAMLIALEAYERGPGPNTLGALLTSLQRADGYLGHIATPETSSNDQWVGFLDDETIVVRTPRSIDVYDLPSRALVSSTPSSSLVSGENVYGAVGGGRFATVTVNLFARTIERGAREPGEDLDLDPYGDDRGYLTVGGTGFVTSVNVGSDGSLIYGTRSGTAVVQSTDPDDAPVTFEGAGPMVVVTALGPNGEVAATQDRNGNLTLWDRATATPRWSWTSGARERWRADSAPIEVGRDDAGRSLLIGLVEGGPAETVPEGFSGLGSELRFSRDGTTIYSLMSGLLAFDVETGRARWTLPTTGSQYQLAELADGTLILGNELIRDGQRVGRLDGIDVDARVAVSDDGTRLVASESDGLSVWSLDGDQLLATGVDRGGATVATLRPDGGAVAAIAPMSGSAWSTVLTDVVTDQPIDPPEGDRWVQYTGDGALISYSDGRVVRAFHPDTFEPLGEPLPPEDFGSIEVDRQRRFVAIGSRNTAEIRIYDIASGREVATLDEPLRSPVTNHGAPTLGGGVHWIDFSPNGELMAASNLGGAAIWETATWTPVAEIEEPPDDGYADLAFSPDGTELALVSEAGTVVVADPATGETSLLANGAVPGIGVNNVVSLEYSPDGTWLVTAGAGASIVDRSSGLLVGTPFPSTAIPSASIAGGGSALVTGTEDHLLVWGLDPEDWADIACRAAGRNMTRNEWAQFGWDGPYQRTCEEWPIPDA